MDRRSFLATGVAAATAGFLAGCSKQEIEVAEPSIFPWDEEFDVVVIGFGGAGATAARYAADAGAKVLILEKAPEIDSGGNTKFCSQMIAYGQGDKDATYNYYKALSGSFPIDDEILRVLTDGVANIWDTCAEAFGLDKSQFIDLGDVYGIYGACEYPEFPGNCAVRLSTLHDGSGDGYLYGLQVAEVQKRADKISVWYESPATKILTDLNGTVVGVKAIHEKNTILIKANNGVVLAAGGYENNHEMTKDYLGLSSHGFLGSAYNTGDGVKLAISAGADLWHMDAYEGMYYMGGMGWPCKEGEHQSYIMAVTPSLTSGSLILVGTAGYRYLNEAEYCRHGHMYANGRWDIPRHPDKTFLVFDQTQYDSIMAAGSLTDDLKNTIVSATTLDELGEKIGTKAGVLAQTVAEFNTAAATGNDPAFHRDPASMRAFDNGPYYAIQTMPDILNTQGGPRRNAKAEIIGVDGNPVPHLYGCGECGGLTSNMYAGGSNMADNIIFGAIAGKNAAAAK